MRAWSDGGMRRRRAGSDGRTGEAPGSCSSRAGTRGCAALLAPLGFCPNLYRPRRPGVFIFARFEQPHPVSAPAAGLRSGTAPAHRSGHHQHPMRTPPRLLPLALSAGVALPLLALGLAGCGGSRPAAPADPLPAAGPSLVAEWDGEDLTLDEFEAAYANSVGGADEAADDSMAALEDFLDRYVNFRLKVRQARDLGLDQDSSLQAEMAEYRDQLARPYFTDQAVLEDIIRDLYEKQQEEIRASHILVMVDAAAPPADTLAAYERTRAFLDSLEAGVPFDDLAFRHSEDPSARRNRGDLGYFAGGRMVEAFEEAAYNTPVGEVAGPLRTRFGYHLIWVQDRRDRTPDIRASHI